MDSDYIQHVRYKLQKRLKRLTAATQKTFRATLVQTWAFLQSEAIAKAILDDLEKRVPHAEAWAMSIISIDSHEKKVGITELENDAIAYWVVKFCATTTLDQHTEQHGNLQLHSIDGKPDGAALFRFRYVEPLFDHIDERIDDRRIMLALLRKYKHRSEWFRRDALRKAFNEDTTCGEKTLAYDLYEYLHDQGIEFHIEPKSESGRVDLISTQTGNDRLVADVKLFNPERGQDGSYLIKGFRQVYDYTKDYNEPFGYMVVFKTCAEDLAILTPKQESGVPFITYNSKTIFIVVIDIFDYSESASKRGKLKAYEISSAQFVASLETGQQP